MRSSNRQPPRHRCACKRRKPEPSGLQGPSMHEAQTAVRPHRAFKTAGVQSCLFGSVNHGVVRGSPLVGKLSPGPDYKLYLSPEFVETESDFKRLKSTMIRIGDVKTFDNFIVSVPAGIDPAKYSAVIVWCETFSEFITAAKSPMASPNSPTCGHPKFPRQDRLDYDDSVPMAMRAAASLSR